MARGGAKGTCHKPRLYLSPGPIVGQVAASAQQLRDFIGTCPTIVHPTAPARRQHRGRCQIVETINGHLIRAFRLHFPGARSPRGLLTRLAAKLAAVNLGHWLNHLFDRPSLAFATLFVG